jgi:hypothetical protein
MDSDLLILMFPAVYALPGKCIVWDSCRAHISKKGKEHCQVCHIELIVIPGGLTPYLQAGDNIQGAQGQIGKHHIPVEVIRHCGA